MCNYIIWGTPPAYYVPCIASYKTLAHFASANIATTSAATGIRIRNREQGEIRIAQHQTHNSSQDDDDSEDNVSGEGRRVQLLIPLADPVVQQE